MSTPNAPEEFTIAELAGAVGDLAVTVAELDTLVRSGATGTASGALVVEPCAWVDTATTQDWAELARWVDWLVSTYDLLNSDTVRPCWPAHRGVSEELAALRSAWRYAAARSGGPEPTEDLITWHDRWLHPTLARLRGAYQQRSCTETTHALTRPGRTTLPELLQQAVDTAPHAAPHRTPG